MDNGLLFYRLAQVWYARCGLRAGEVAVIAADSGTDQRAIAAFFDTALATGAAATLAYFERPTQPFADVPAIVEQAMLEADFVHDLTSFAWSQSPSRARVVRAIQTGARGRMTWGGGQSAYLEVPPDERVIARTQRAAALLDGAREFRVTSSLGTDITWKRGDPAARPMLRQGGDCDQPGRIGGLDGAVAYAPEDGSAEGVCYVNGGVVPTDPTHARPWLIEEPVRIEVARGRIVRVDTSEPDGRRIARWLRAFDDPRVHQFVETGLGLDHRATLHRAGDRQGHAASAWGTIHLTFGRNSDPLLGIDHEAPARVTLILADHDGFVDGRQIVRNGAYVEDSGPA